MIEPIAAAAMGYILVLFIVAAYVAKLVGATEPLVNTSVWARAAVGALALGGPWLVYDAGLLPVPEGPPGHAVVLTTVMMLWLSAERLIDLTGRDRSGGANATGSPGKD